MRLRGARLALGLEPLVEIGADRLHQRIDLAVEEVVGARDHLLLDHDALLGLELVDQPGDVLVRHHRVLVAVHDHARGRAGSEERKIIEVRRRRDRDEALDLGPPHQELHADPGAEGEAGDPAAPGLRIERLRPIERRSGVRQLSQAVVERALAASDAAEIEAQHGEVPVHESVVELIDDLVVHRAPELRMRVKHDGDRRILLPSRVIAPLYSPGRAGEDDLGHAVSNLDWAPGPRALGARLTATVDGRKRLEPFQILAGNAAGRGRRGSRRAPFSTDAGAKSKHFEGCWARAELWSIRPSY